MVEPQRVAFETARLALAKLNIAHSDAGFAAAMKISACALNIERVGVWLFDIPNERLECRVMFTASTGAIGGGDVIVAKDNPKYWTALRDTRTIVASDAQHDERTDELSAGYLRPLGVTSMLDAPIFQDGEVVGVVCHEHVGPSRTWSQSDIAFAASVADLVALMMEHDRRLKAEQELRTRLMVVRDSERLDVVTRLAAAVAHDFRNVFTALGLITQKLEAQRHEMAPTLRASMGLGQFLTAQLDSFAHRPTDSAIRCDAVAVVAQMRPMLNLLLRGAADLFVDLPSEPLWVYISPGGLEQTLLNLVLNARDAVAESGRIEIAVSRVTSSRANLAVIDNGRGIPVESLQKVFELGYSTRSEGTGIGLATVRETLTAFQATIAVSNQATGGARFDVSLRCDSDDKT
jgi:two-component system, cell cycle sensor histidine kinase and response regulator CckA